MMREMTARNVMRSDRHFSLRWHWEVKAGIFYTIRRIMKWRDDFCSPSLEKKCNKKSQYLLSMLRYVPPPFEYSKGESEIEENWLTKGGVQPLIIIAQCLLLNELLDMFNGVKETIAHWRCMHCVQISFWAVWFSVIVTVFCKGC